MKHQSKKIILNNENDLLKYDVLDYKHIKLSNFQGEYFKQLLQEAIDIENNKKSLDQIGLKSTSTNKNEIEINHVEFEIFHKTEVNQFNTNSIF